MSVFGPSQIERKTISNDCSKLVLSQRLLTIVRKTNYSRTSTARTPLEQVNMFEAGVVRANEC